MCYERRKSKINIQILYNTSSGLKQFFILSQKKGIKKIKKILIGSEEICGIVAKLTTYYRSIGYEVVSVAGQNPFYKFTYDIDPNMFLEGWMRSPQENILVKSVIKLIYTLAPLKTKQNIIAAVKKRFIQKFDLYINIWNCFLEEEVAFSAVKEKNGKWITIMVGDDFRNRNVFKTHFEVSNELLKDIDEDTEHLLSKMKRMRLHEKNADIIFSVPDQSSLALRPYFHFQLPIELSELNFHLPENKKIKIVHCPSDSNAKGTSVVEKVMTEIINEGYAIEFLSLRKIPHIELMKILEQTDILVDELVFHGPGFLSFEAMGCGCAVLTRYIEDSPECFRPPVVSVTPQTLKEKLTTLLNNKEKIKELAIAGRKYVEENNNLVKIADGYLDKLANTGQFDYYPDYFRNKFNPSQFGLNTEKVNALTSTVVKTNWYKQWVKIGNNHQLRF